MYVLMGTRTGFEVISATTVTREPISVLPDVRFKWRTLAVHVSGGGTAAGEALLQFDGSRYPGNPTTQPRASKAYLLGATVLQLAQ